MDKLNTCSPVGYASEMETRCPKCNPPPINFWVRQVSNGFIISIGPKEILIKDPKEILQFMK